MIASNAADLGASLRAARRAKGMSQQALAVTIGVTRQWVISAEKGAPTAQVNLMLSALRAVDLLVDVVADESTALAEQIFGERHGQ